MFSSFIYLSSLSVVKFAPDGGLYLGLEPDATSLYLASGNVAPRTLRRTLELGLYPLSGVLYAVTVSEVVNQSPGYVHGSHGPKDCPLHLVSEVVGHHVLHRVS